MKSFLSRLNRRRLFSRAERRANAFAVTAVAQMDEAQKGLVRSVLGKFAPVQCGHEMTRVGPADDGGYIMPDDLKGVVALYSPGVSETLGFDLEIATQGVPCFLADGSVEEPKNLHDLMSFEKMMIGEGPKEQFMSMDSWVARTAPLEGDLLLQMDIEGAEYDVLEKTSRELLDRFRVIVLELHNIDRLLLSTDITILDNFLTRLLENHVICHVHPNNVTAPVQILGEYVPPLLELTLIRKDRVSGPATEPAPYPHPQDALNDANSPTREFPAFWNALSS